MLTAEDAAKRKAAAHAEQRRAAEAARAAQIGPSTPRQDSGEGAYRPQLLHPPLHHDPRGAGPLPPPPGHPGGAGPMGRPQMMMGGGMGHSRRQEIASGVRDNGAAPCSCSGFPCAHGRGPVVEHARSCWSPLMVLPHFVPTPPMMLTPPPCQPSYTCTHRSLLFALAEARPKSIPVGWH